MTYIEALDFSAESDLKPRLWEKLQERVLAKKETDREPMSFEELSSMYTSNPAVQAGTTNREPEKNMNLSRSL